jgi:hypothetical protein
MGGQQFAEDWRAEKKVGGREGQESRQQMRGTSKASAMALKRSVAASGAEAFLS